MKISYYLCIIKTKQQVKLLIITIMATITKNDFEALNLYTASVEDVKAVVVEKLEKAGLTVLADENEAEEALRALCDEEDIEVSENKYLQIHLDETNSEGDAYDFKVLVREYYSDAGSADYYYVVEVW